MNPADPARAQHDGCAARPRRRMTAICVLLLVALTAGACGSTGDDAGVDDASPSGPELVFPNPEWVEVTPGEAGVDATALQDMADLAEAGGSNCLVVTRDGALVGEWYWNGTDADTPGVLNSATKSLTSALVGIAHDRGELDIDEPASTYITEWQGTDSEDVTIRNLLGNDSGREWSYGTDYVDFSQKATDKTQFAVELSQQYPPGTEWEYNNAAIQTLERVMTEATGADVADYAQEHLFGPLGMTAEYAHDEAGNTVMWRDVETTCRDLARFGYLWLRHGEWDGEQVVSPGYVEASTTPTDLNSAYGLLFWLNRNGHWVDKSTAGAKPEGDGLPIDGVPDDVFYASGLGNQLSVVYPSSGVVVSRMGPSQQADAGTVPADEFAPSLLRLGAALSEGSD